MGTGGGGSGGSGDKDVGAGGASSPPSATTPSSIVGSAGPAAASTSVDASGDAGNSGAGVGVGGAISIATLTANAAARGLRALANDSNYHLRQIFILAVQVPDYVLLITRALLTIKLSGDIGSSVSVIVSSLHMEEGLKRLARVCSSAA